MFLEFLPAKRSKRQKEFWKDLRNLQVLRNQRSNPYACMGPNHVHRLRHYGYWHIEEDQTQSDDQIEKKGLEPACPGAKRVFAVKDEACNPPPFVLISMTGSR